MPTLADTLSGAVQPTTPGTSLSSYTPGLRDRVSGWVQDLVEGLGGSRGLGQHWGEGARMALEGNPISGPFLAAGDTQEAIAGGRYKDAAKSAVGLLPLLAPESKFATAVADEASVAPTLARATVAPERPPGPVQGPPNLPPGFDVGHGSQHNFERFDVSKIGTGEGAQAYGHGLYFAENPDVYQGYRNKLEGRPIPGRWPEVAAPPPAYESDEYLARQVMDSMNGNRSAAISELERRRDSLSQVPAHVQAPGAVDSFNRTIDVLRSGKDLGGGKIYNVRITADPEHFLDWDRPLSEQSPLVQSTMARLGVSGPESRFTQSPLTTKDPTGDMAYRRLGGDPAARSAALSEAGIPGIKFLDQGSRNAATGTGTRNYVVFDDKNTFIKNKYGLVGAGAAGAGGVGYVAGGQPDDNQQWLQRGGT
jgi:hypothetical protein